MLRLSVFDGHRLDDFLRYKKRVCNDEKAHLLSRASIWYRRRSSTWCSLLSRLTRISLVNYEALIETVEGLQAEALERTVCCRSSVIMASVVPRALKALLGLVLWGLFLFWVVEWFIYPTDRWATYKADAIAKTSTKFLELNGESYSKPKLHLTCFDHSVWRNLMPDFTTFRWSHNISMNTTSNLCT